MNILINNIEIFAQSNIDNETNKTLLKHDEILLYKKCSFHFLNYKFYIIVVHI